MRIFAGANFPFLGWRRRAYILSGVLLVAGLIAMGINIATRGSWLIYGVDFTGGTVVHVDFAGDVQADQVRSANSEWEISGFGDPAESQYMIRVATFEQSLEVDPASEVARTLTAAFGENSFQVVSTGAVGPRVAEELQQKALLAILISFGVTLVYLAFRFEWRFGVAALIATAHDILITLGLVAILRVEISISIIAAFLTLVGYSLNDTIVVFDRIRENRAKRVRGESWTRTIDRSVNETLPRTVMTSVTTSSTLLALYLFGGPVIRDFVFVLIMGVAIGTFSSIFVASPALAAIEKRWPRTSGKPSPGTTGVRRRETAGV
jgi:preprotein translocase subunit SecF